MSDGKPGIGESAADKYIKKSVAVGTIKAYGSQSTG
jgi:hypothetical protein